MKANLEFYFKLLRIKDWRGYFLITTLGFVISKGFLFPIRDIIIFYTLSFFLLAFGFSINDCFDTKEDRLDKDKKNPIALKKISLRNGLIFSILLAVLGLALSTVFGMKVFLFCLMSILIGFFYSSPPLRMKSRPWFDLISHGLFAGALLFLIPVLIFSKELTKFHCLIALSIFYFSVILELRNHIEDYEIDKEAGLNTTVVFLGREKSEKLLRYLAVFYPLTLFPIFLFYQQFFLLFSILTVIFLFLFQKKDHKIKDYKIIDVYANLSFILLSIVTIFE
jgi:4-hydroxybenzoate polyprenyltransferase